MNSHLKFSLALFLPLLFQAAADELPRAVFAHYMTCFSQTPANYRREILLAQRYGIDGFALNCGEWLKPGKDNRMEPTRYVVNADALFEEARRNAPDFKFFLSPDFAGAKIRELPKINVNDMLTRYYHHPNLYRRGGKAVLSGWAGTVEDYAVPAADLRSKNYDFLLIPNAHLRFNPMMMSHDLVARRLFAPGSPLDGWFNFICDGSLADLVRNNAESRRGCMLAGKLYMAGICPAYNSSNVRDYKGLTGFAVLWENIIRDNPEMVEIVTWNDYQEDSNLMPARWTNFGGAANEKGAFNRDESFLDVNAYYSTWYKNGRAPEITQDKLFYAYRNRSKHLPRSYDAATGRWIDHRAEGRFVEQIHDDCRDMVYVTTFLTGTAKLEIRQGDHTVHADLPPGVAHFETPMIPGTTPQFKLTRGGEVLLDISGRKQIVAEPTPENSPAGPHFANRTWATAAAVGKPVRTFAAGDAKLDKVSLRDQALHFQPGGEARWDLGKPGVGGYHFFVSYRNSGNEEARLTLYSDAMPEVSAERGFSFPVFLPPTGGKPRTVTFLLTLWGDRDATIALRKDFSADPRLAKLNHNDGGDAAIEKIELIPNRIFNTAAPCPALPEMVSLPGGTFRMGSVNGGPDERPVRTVTVRPFALGRYEVTNREFEEYLPPHRQLREAWSWRDREPVVCISWTQAAGYCNHLSRKHGLTPYYRESDWTVNPAADGFRLPSETQWEYAASGRGENRIYPWGNAAPTRQLANLDPSPFTAGSVIPASPGGGTTVVGAYPAGNSRDGIADLAGNVSEWCDDWYNITPRDTADDGPDLRRSRYRAIRGGSWGYYNASQRCADREFNNPGYPGYIYIGFRVALPADAWQKLSQPAAQPAVKK